LDPASLHSEWQRNHLSFLAGGYRLLLVQIHRDDDRSVRIRLARLSANGQVHVVTPQSIDHHLKTIFSAPVGRNAGSRMIESIFQEGDAPVDQLLHAVRICGDCGSGLLVHEEFPRSSCDTPIKSRRALNVQNLDDASMNASAQFVIRPKKAGQPILGEAVKLNVRLSEFRIKCGGKHRPEIVTNRNDLAHRRGQGFVQRFAARLIDREVMIALMVCAGDDL